jgi:hypothetical protein
MRVGDASHGAPRATGAVAAQVCDPDSGVTDNVREDSSCAT